MRKAILILFLLLLPTYLLAEAPSDQSNNVAHGSEKVAHEIAHPHENHGEGTEEPKTYFGIPAWILKLINMFLFIGALVYFAGGPVKKSFVDRREAIRRGAEEAQARRAKADQLAHDIQARLGAIEQEVKSIHERAQQEGERQKRELIAAAEAEAAKILTNAKNEVENRLKLARHELTEFAGQLASDRAEAILRERINESDQHKLFQESLNQVSEVRS